MQTETPLSWKQQLSQLKSLTKDDAKTSWQIAGIVHRLLNDQEFLADCGDVRSRAEGRIAKLTAGRGFLPSEWYTMFDEFSDWSHWQNGRIDLLNMKAGQAVQSRSSVRSRSLKEMASTPAPTILPDALIKPCSPQRAIQPLPTPAPTCASCEELRAEIARLKLQLDRKSREITQLKNRLKRHASNLATA